MEGKDGGADATVAGIVAGGLEQGLMAAMNTVKVADGQGTRAKAALGRIHGKVNLRGHAPNRPMGISRPS